MERMGLSTAMEGIHFHEPFGFFDFVRLEQHAGCVLSDSGTVQEECCIFGVPNVTIRDVTERPETIECGSNILSGAESDMILRCVHYLLSRQSAGSWTPPPEYLNPSVANTVIKILLGYHH
jgi:UDP-N-acetylglucosamine 2-epimerase (non-hydrolysing)